MKKESLLLLALVVGFALIDLIMCQGFIGSVNSIQQIHFILFYNLFFSKIQVSK